MRKTFFYGLSLILLIVIWYFGDQVAKDIFILMAALGILDAVGYKLIFRISRPKTVVKEGGEKNG